MRIKNRKVLQDKTPGNTPKQEIQSQRKRHVKDIREESELLPRALTAHQQSPLKTPGSSSPARMLPVESTPLTRRHHRARMPAKGRSTRQPFSPLPPSSPPSSVVFPVRSVGREEDFVYAQENAFDEYDENVGEDKENIAASAIEHIERAESSSSDDPFGFLAVERQLKVRRDLSHHSSIGPTFKGKGIDRKARTPLGELLYEPVASSSALHQRAPTPYHPSDDLEDMYAEVAQDADKENLQPSPRRIALAALEREIDDEDDRVNFEEAEEELEETENVPALLAPPPPASDAMSDVLRTPRHSHVAKIIPLSSPFSSREGTPCDRSLPASPLSSPSPMKPLTAIRPLPLASTKKPTGATRSRQIAFMRALSSIKRPATQKKEMALSSEMTEVPTDSPTTVVRNLKGMLPERPVRRSVRASIVASATPAKPVSRAGAKGKGKQKVEIVESDAEDDYEEERSSPAARKRKTEDKPQPPAKKAKMQPPPATRAPTSRRAKPASNAKTRAKGKGKDTGKVDEENSVCHPSL